MFKGRNLGVIPDTCAASDPAARGAKAAMLLMDRERPSTMQHSTL